VSEGRDPVTAAEVALADGRPWEARDRLSGYMAQHADDLYAQALLGDAWWQLRDPARAGRWWFLTDRDGPQVQEAVAAWRETRRAADLARSLGVASEPERTYSPPALARLSWLEAEVAAEGADWRPGCPVRMPGHETRPRRTARAVRNTVLVVALLLATVGIWMVGVVALAIWLA
jgi:hypothetical protein